METVADIDLPVARLLAGMVVGEDLDIFWMVTKSGRAMTAHHVALVSHVFGVERHKFS
jgi:arginine decarboxylase-like protein